MRLTARGQAVDVGQQLRLGNSWVSHQADVDGALRGSKADMIMNSIIQATRFIKCCGRRTQP